MRSKNSQLHKHCLGAISNEDFLKNYWQKKPLLIKAAFANTPSPISAEELAGLACEEDINSRLVLEKDGDRPWQVEFGPFEESRFSQLPKTHWSLLVSDVEKHLPETRFLLKAFHFIPDWRVDDLMVSYAPEGGSVGAHTDAYDVFLIQLSGQRLWKIAEQYPDETLEDIDLCILKKFTAEKEWLLEAGDMLYLPPNVAHHGIAQKSEQPCLTASVGFRAPSIKTMTSDFVNYLNENTHDERRYHDNSTTIPTHHAEISEQTVSHFTEYLKQGLSIEHEHVKNWLGQYSSDNKTYEDLLVEQNIDNYEQLAEIANHSSLEQSPYSHFLFSKTKTGASLFVNGNRYTVSLKFAENICSEDQLDFQLLQSIITAEDEEVFLDLFNSGAIITVEDLI